MILVHNKNSIEFVNHYIVICFIYITKIIRFIINFYIFIFYTLIYLGDFVNQFIYFDNISFCLIEITFY